MKTKLIFFGFLCFNLSFGQAPFNQSNDFVRTVINNPANPLSSEVFRFRSGLVTQLDSGNNFDLSPNSQFNSRWFSLGGIQTSAPGTPAKRAYGLRFQADNKALTFGYQNVLDANDINPRIQWIGTGAALGNLEFRVADSFDSTNSTLVASMLSNGGIVFGDFFEPSNTPTRLEVRNSAVDFEVGIAIDASAGNADQVSIGVKGSATTLTPFSAGIYGVALSGINQYAGYFDGRIFASNFMQPSDRRLKLDPRYEDPLLARIAQLNPVTYTFDKRTELNLPEGTQHGFIAQDVEKIFPELVKEITKPVFGKDGKVTSNFTFKSVDYLGMISILTGGIKELNEKITKLESQLAEKSEKSSLKSTNSLIENSKSAFIEQNIPNPFADQTTISYQLTEGTNTAEIIVFDLNGKLIKSFPINKNQSELTIKASDVGSGLFLYSLVQNGQEIMTKKMIIKS